MLLKLYQILLQRRLYYYLAKSRLRNWRYLGPLFLGRSSSLSIDKLADQFEYILYFDSDDKSSVLQIEKWFAFGFLKKDRALIIFNQHRSTRRHYFEFFESNGFSFVSIADYRRLYFKNSFPIFYVFNSITNPYLINNTHCTHIFIGHGESDKQASINPMLKMYDHIWVSGDNARARLIQAGITAASEADKKILQIGLPSVGDISREPAKTTEGCTNLLYAPTWEGSLPTQEYSSLNNDVAKSALSLLIETFQPATLTIKPHPSTGKKNLAYAAYLNELCAYFAPKIDLRLVVDPDSHIFQKISTEFEISHNYMFSDADVMVVDVSSMISTALQFNIPYVVLHMEKNFLAISEPLSEALPLCAGGLNFIEGRGILELDPTAAQPQEILARMRSKLTHAKNSTISLDPRLRNASDNSELFSAALRSLSEVDHP